jgi:hypothetical protein
LLSVTEIVRLPILTHLERIALPLTLLSCNGEQLE